jgi:hypothetical protein
MLLAWLQAHHIDHAQQNRGSECLASRGKT